MIVYRGLSNIYQALKIAENLTFGGYDILNCGKCSLYKPYCEAQKHQCKNTTPTMSELLNNDNISPKITVYTNSQIEHGESLFKIVMCVDTTRFLIEYTTKEAIAMKYGFLGYVKAEYNEDTGNGGHEGGFFVPSCTGFQIGGVKFYKNTSAQEIITNPMKPITNNFEACTENKDFTTFIKGLENFKKLGCVKSKFEFKKTI